MIPLMLALLTALFIVAPLFIVVPMSFTTSTSFAFPPAGYGIGYYRAYFDNPEWLIPTANSFIIAFSAMLVTMLLVIPAAFAFVRNRFVGKAMINLLFLMPLAVPHVVSALGYYGLLGRLGIVGSHLGMIIAETALSMPVSFLVICAVLKGYDRNLERAAMSAGAGPLRTFLWVTLPVLRPGILVGALFAFLQTFNESVVALFIGGPDAVTLPKKMFESIRVETDPVIAVVSTLLTGIVVLVFVVPVVFRRKPTYVP
jgi:putative spermidine/putrescine transport system permease protein